MGYDHGDSFPFDFEPNRIIPNDQIKGIRSIVISVYAYGCNHQAYGRNQMVEYIPSGRARNMANYGGSVLINFCLCNKHKSCKRLHLKKDFKYTH